MDQKRNDYAGKITNARLICRDCLFRYDDTIRRANTARCMLLDVKPTPVLLGGKCEKYTKDS